MNDIINLIEEKEIKFIDINKEIESENNSNKREMLLIKKNELINSKFELIKIVNNILMKNKNNKYQIDNEESVNNKDIQQICIKRKKEFNSSEENSS